MFLFKGVPSGHAMVTTAVWFIMMSSLATYLQSANQKSRTTKLLSLLPWLFLSGLASVVCVSRVFIASHFTHQVFLGVFVGMSSYTLQLHCAIELFRFNLIGPDFWEFMYTPHKNQNIPISDKRQQ